MPSPMTKPSASYPRSTEDVPARERVLAAADGDEHALARLDHRELVDRLRDLVAAHAQEVLGAVVGVLPAHVDDRRAAAHAALHAQPARDDRPDLHRLVAGEHGVAGHERVAFDDEHRLAVELEAG